MQFSRFFIDRPIFATVLALVIVIIGLIACYTLPIAEYPEIVPPTIVVNARYPGASPQIIADTVATPLEQEINGVERMLYMASQSTSDGQMALTITFQLGTDLDKAQVLVQNRVAIAEPRLPEIVRRFGITTQKTSPDLLLVVHLLSPDNRYDQAYIGNYALIQIRDVLTRLEGVGNLTLFGLREFSMRVWLDPDKLASLNMTAGDAVQALREQNVQVAAGIIGQPPTPSGNALQLSVTTQGRLLQPEQFGDIIIKTGANGRMTRLRDIARVELGARDYSANSYLDGKAAMAIAVLQRPGSNALATANGVRKTMAELSKNFPKGLEYRIVYDPTVFIRESVNAVTQTLIEAFALVFVVVLIFLQDWRATLLPMIDVPVSLIGTFGVMAALGFSLNNLSLFGLVLAIGIVVDDAIVVVENVERWMAKGLPPREATIKALEEITGPVIAITLVLSSVFIPTAFIAGISGQFYRQFALTIAASTIISAINAMTMAPARAVTLIKPHAHGEERREALPRTAVVLLGALLADVLFTGRIQGLFGVSAGGHGHEAHGSAAALWAVRLAVVAAGGVVGYRLNERVNRARLVGATGIILVVYGGLMVLTWLGFRTVPVGFIPEQDKGYLVVNAQLPDGASLERTEEVMARLDEMVRATPGVGHTIRLPGYSILTSNNISNVGGMFVILQPFEERVAARLPAAAVAASLRAQFRQVQDAIVVAFGAPPVDGLGNTGGFKLQVQDRADAGPEALQGAVETMIRAGTAQPGLVGLFSSYRAAQPQLYLDVDRAKAKALGVSLNDVFQTLQIYLGSAYANDFTRFGRNWQVNIQADAKYRVDRGDIGQLKVRNRNEI